MSLFIYVMPGYQNITTALLLSGKPFGTSMNAAGTFVFQGIFRNNGIFFDCRILGIFTYIYVYILGLTSKDICVKDVLLTFLTVLTTLSRGGILVYVIVLIGYLLTRKKGRIRTIFLCLSCVICAFLAVMYIPSINSKVASFIATFNLNNANNVLSQRSVMSTYAISSFLEHSLFGGGFGSLTATGVNRIVYSDSHVTYNVVTDAYLYSLLGEVGLIGTVLFLAQFYQIVRNHSTNYILSLLLYRGMILHMLGTDIPNMRLVYFSILILIYLANLKSDFQKHMVSTNS